MDRQALFLAKLCLSVYWTFVISSGLFVISSSLFVISLADAQATSSITSEAEGRVEKSIVNAAPQISRLATLPVRLRSGLKARLTGDLTRNRRAILLNGHSIVEVW